MIDKVSKQRIKQLKKDKKYNEIYVEFGMKAYNKYVPSYIRGADLIKLNQEGKYEDIYNKYGKEKYNSLLINAMYREIKETKGTAQAAIWRIKQRILNTAKAIGISSALVFFEITSIGARMTELTIMENATQYESEIEDYNTKISNYADKVNTKELSDIQVFMKVMDDMWENIQGYGKPQKDIAGFWELDLNTPEGYGVCRNMASDIAKKLNEINPKYNARTITAKMGKNGFYQIADIERAILETNDTVVEEDNQQSEHNEILENILNEVIGNHMVTLVDLPEYRLTVVLDPTNPGIGIYQDGKIIMLNSSKENGLDFEAKEWGNAICIQGGVDGIINTAQDYIKSYRKSTLSVEEIEEKFGLEAQNEALKEVREMYKEDEEISKANEETINAEIIQEDIKNPSIEESPKTSFKEDLKVENIQENNQEINKNEIKIAKSNQEKNEIENEK